MTLLIAAEPPPTRDVNRDSGTDSANGGWLLALARQLAVDLWRWQTGKITPEQLGWVMV